MGASTVAATLGQVGLPAPLPELAARTWDVVVVGGGHNGLTAAAYLARAGRSVLVLERRERLGGACTLEQPFADPGYLVSPCAYVVGLLDQTVVDELGLEALRLPGVRGRPQPVGPVRRRHLGGPVRRPRPDRGPPAGQPLLRARHPGDARLRGHVRPAAPGPADRARGRHLAGRRPDPRPARQAAGPRPRADLGAVRGVDRRHPRPLRRRPADEGRPVRPGGHRRLGRPQGPGHRLHQAHALPGRPARPGPAVGLRRGRDGPDLVRHRPGRPRPRRPAGHRGAGGRDPARRGGAAGGRRADPGGHGRLQRRPQADPRPGRPRAACPATTGPGSTAGRSARRW